MANATDPRERLKELRGDVETLMAAERSAQLRVGRLVADRHSAAEAIAELRRIRDELDGVLAAQLVLRARLPRAPLEPWAI